MKNFETEKYNLINAIKVETGKFLFMETLEKLKSLLTSLDLHSEFDGTLSKLVLEAQNISSKTKEKVIDFENYFGDKTNLIKSDALRQVAKDLKDTGIAINYFGKAWSKQPVNWIYFDTVLDVKQLRTTYSLRSTIIDQENLDPRSGTERGFIDTQTGEGVMGKLNS